MGNAVCDDVRNDGDTFVWTAESHVQCTADCQLDYTSCIPMQHAFVFMNWNVLHGGWDCLDPACQDKACDREQCAKVRDYDGTSDGRDVLPRAEKVYQIIQHYDKKPDVIAVVETSGDWHGEIPTQYFKNLGYDWVDNTKNPENYAHYQSNLFYQSEKYEVLEHGVLNFIYSDDDPRGYGGRVINDANNISTMHAVFKNKEDGVIFIILSTHWDAHSIRKKVPNPDSSEPNLLQNIIGWTVAHELNRVKCAQDSVLLINELRQKYPDAHVLYAGDLNTMDFNMLFASPLAPFLDNLPREAVGEMLGTAVGKISGEAPFDATEMLPETISFKDMPSLIQTTKDILAGTSYPVFGDDFIGAYQAFAQHSGLTDARVYAIANIEGTQDTWSTNHPSLVQYETMLGTLAGLTMVADYTFFSPGLRLKRYQMMTYGDGKHTREDYVFISDHFPLLTEYDYDISE